MTLITTTINGAKKYINVTDVIGRKMIVRYEDHPEDAEDFFTEHNARTQMPFINNPHNHPLDVEEVDVNID